MADEARSRLGRGLAALIGDVGDEAAALERTRSQRRVPIEFLKPNPRNPRRTSPKPSSTSLRRRSASAASSSRSSCAPCAARSTNTRSSPASGAGARRSAPACTMCRSSCSKSSDREALELAIIENVQRADLNALEEARRLSGARRRVQLQPGRHREDRRQEPQPCGQHAAAAEAAGRRAGVHPRRQALRRSCARAARPARSGSARGGDRRARPERASGRSDRAGARRVGRQDREARRARREGCRHASRWRSGCRTRSASR